MKRRWVLGTVALLLAASLAGLDAYLRLHDAAAPSREAVLSFMPASASAVAFADLTELRRSPFAAEFYNWIPKNQVDADYAQFSRETGFDYERDLDRVAIALIKAEKDSKLFAVAQGRFDRKKIESYAARSGTRENRAGREIFSVPLDSGARKLSFAFVGKDIIALTDAEDIASFIARVGNGLVADGADRRDWRERFKRVAGSPVLAVIRQDSEAGSALAARAPGGFQSPQLASLLNQLQWITLAAKPQEGAIRIVAEGECPSAQISQQLSDILNGMLALAQAGLNGPETRRGLDPRLRDAYLDMIKGTEISRIDRAGTKSVRVVFDVTSNFLQAVSATAPTAPAVIAPATTPTSKTRAHKRSQKSVGN
jgi:hypothetical protein